MKTKLLVAVAALTLSSVSSFAETITDKADIALNGASLIDFESVAAGSFSSFTVDGVTFSTPESGKSIYVSSSYSGNYGAVGQSLQNTYSSNAFGILDFNFAMPVSAFAFNWGASDNQWTLRAWDASNNLLDTVMPAITNSSNDGYTGIKFAGNVISRAQLSGPNGDYVFIDNFKSVSAVPEPETYAMLLAGLGLVGAIARRRKQKSLTA
jgi:hypothetical protein